MSVWHVSNLVGLLTIATKKYLFSHFVFNPLWYKGSMREATFILAVIQFVLVCKYAKNSPPSTLFEDFTFLVLIALPTLALFPFFYPAPERRPNTSQDQ